MAAVIVHPGGLTLSDQEPLSDEQIEQLLLDAEQRLSAAQSGGKALTVATDVGQSHTPAKGNVEFRFVN